MKTKLKILLITGLATGAFVSARAAEAAVPAVVQFNRDVRPIMANTCFKCHGPDIKGNKSDLRLDLPEEALRPRTDKTGRKYTPIVPGNPKVSEVWLRIISPDQAVQMPPPDSLHLLSARDKEVIRRWITQGAKYEPHWAYLPARKTEPPAVKGSVRNPIDQFILKELVERDISPSPEADRRTLIRRLSLDLLGLPPTVEDVEDFVTDPRADAYEKLVERLLASRHYGERMAISWLDLARFADTVGFHGDQRYNNFPYRDYVIDAFNRNLPYDQFTREQIAGDLLPGATEAQRVASGFNRLNMVTREGGAQPKEMIAKYAADRVRTISTVWLGSTMGCAECHDHKYDPYKAKDFYTMAAYFADIKQYGVYGDYEYTPEPELKGTNNDSPFPPEIEVESPYLKARIEQLKARNVARIDRVSKAIVADPQSATALRAWVDQVAPVFKENPSGWSVVPVNRTKYFHEGNEVEVNANSPIRILPDQSVRFEFVKDPIGWRKGSGAYLTLAATAGPVSSIRLEALPDEMFDGRVTNKNAGGYGINEDLFALTFTLSVQRAGQDKPEPAPFADGFAEQGSDNYFNGHTVTSVLSAWRSSPKLLHARQIADFILEKPLLLLPGDRLIAKIKSEDVGRVRISTSPFGLRSVQTAEPADLAAAFVAANPTPAQQELLAAEYFKATGAGRPGEITAIVRDLREIGECRGGRTFTTVTVATSPRITRVLPRGNWQDESGPELTPSPPAFLLAGKAPGAESLRPTRLDLVNWLVARDNPLTARSFMNRLWRQYFGTGLSTVVDDLGIQGEYPSHPELLDWLAVEFMDRGWDIKAMVRTLVTSATYRQSSKYRPELAELDPNNRLLARQSARRLEAESVRDNALSAAGLLNLDMGGPSVYPYQPEGYYAALQFPDRDYVADRDDRQYRRGVYMHWQRTFLHPMLANFDAPSREECTALRNISSTPQQALTLLNDPTFVEAARGLAEQALAGTTGQEFNQGLEKAFRRLLARPPSDREIKSLREFFDTQLVYYRGQPAEAQKAVSVGLQPAPTADPATLAAWMSVSRVLLNLNETIVRY